MSIILTVSPEKENRVEARYSRGQYPSNENTCFCCGRKAGSHWVAIDLTDMTTVPVEVAQSDENDTAFFPVGPTCRKTFGIPRDHIITRLRLWGKQ